MLDYLSIAELLFLKF